MTINPAYNTIPRRLTLPSVGETDTTIIEYLKRQEETLERIREENTVNQKATKEEMERHRKEQKQQREEQERAQREQEANISTRLKQMEQQQRVREDQQGWQMETYQRDIQEKEAHLDQVRRNWEKYQTGQEDRLGRMEEQIRQGETRNKYPTHGGPPYEDHPQNPEGERNIVVNEMEDELHADGSRIDMDVERPAYAKVKKDRGQESASTEEQADNPTRKSQTNNYPDTVQTNIRPEGRSWGITSAPHIPDGDPKQEKEGTVALTNKTLDTIISMLTTKTGRKTGHPPKVTSPKPFAGNGENLDAFQKQFRKYSNYHKLGKEAAELLSLTLTGDALEYLDSLNQADTEDLDTVFQKLRERFCPASFRLIQHEKFVSNKQGQDEDVSEYIRRFSKSAKLLKLPENQLVAQFTSNLNSAIKEDVMLFNPATLTDAYERARVKCAAMQCTKDKNPLEAQIKRLVDLQEQQVYNSNKSEKEKPIEIAALQEEVKNLKEGGSLDREIIQQEFRNMREEIQGGNRQPYGGPERTEWGNRNNNNAPQRWRNQNNNITQGWRGQNNNTTQGWRGRNNNMTQGWRTQNTTLAPEWRGRNNGMTQGPRRFTPNNSLDRYNNDRGFGNNRPNAPARYNNQNSRPRWQEERNEVKQIGTRTENEEGPKTPQGNKAKTEPNNTELAKRNTYLEQRIKQMESQGTNNPGWERSKMACFICGKL